MFRPWKFGIPGPGRYVGTGGEGNGVQDPIVTDINGDVTITGKVKAGSFGKFVYPLASVQAGRVYTFRVVANFAQLSKQGKLAMVGFGFKTDNQFHITGLRGDGSTGTNGYAVYGTPPNGWNKETGHTEDDDGAASAGTQHSAFYKLTTSADGTTYTLETDTDGTSYAGVFAAKALTPFSNVSAVTTFGIALWFNNADTGPFSLQVTQFADAEAATTPLDGLSNLTAAWSMSRDLLTTFIGGSRYTLNGSNVSSFNDQSGNNRHLAQGNAGAQPPTTTAGPNSRTAIDFVTASQDSLVGAATSNFFTVSAGYVIASVYVDSINTNEANVYANDPVWADDGGIVGFSMKDNAGTRTGHGFNWDGNSDLTTHASFPLTTALVIEWRHDGGNIITRINGGSEQTVASGNSTSLAGLLSIGVGWTTAAKWSDLKFFEMATFSVVPDATTRDTLSADFMDWIGAT